MKVLGVRSVMIVQIGMVGVLLLQSTLLAQVPKQKRTEPDRSKRESRLIVKERVVDLGRLKQGEKGIAKFLLENQGTAPVHISSVRASCGCTVPRRLTDDEKLLEPGETVEIVAEFDSKGRRGKQRKTVTVMSDDPIEPRLQLLLTAEIFTVMEVLIDGRPLRTIPLRRVGAGQEISTKIEVLPTEPDESLEVTSVAIETDSLSHKLEPLTKDDRTGYRLRLSVVPDAVPGPITASVRINARVGEELAYFTARVTGEIIGELTFTPRQIKQTSPVIIGSKLTPVKIRSESKTPFDILGVDAGPNVEAEVSQQRGGYEYLITPRIRESASPGPFGTFLEIRTSSVVQPVIRIPIFGYVRPGVEVYPSVVFLRQDDTEKSSARTVKLETARRGRLELTEITIESPYLSAKEVEVPGRMVAGVKFVRIELVGNPPPGTHDAVVRIKADARVPTELAIPVTFVVR